MRTGRLQNAHIIGVLVGALLCSAGCRPELPDPPDPNEPTPTVACEEGGPLGLASTSADSVLDTPPWIELCALCPVDLLEVEVLDAEGGVIPAFVAWTEAGSCAAAVPLADPPGVESLTARVRLVEGERAGSFEFDFALPPPVPPPDAAAAVFRFDWEEARPRSPAVAPLVPAAEARPFLLALSATDGGAGPVTLAGTDEEGRLQAPCEATSEPTAPAVMTDGRFVLPLSAGDALLQPLPLTVHSGVLRGRVAEDGGALRDLTLAARVDLPAMEPIWGLSPEDACLAFAEDGAVCAPCDEPSAGLDGPPLCLTVVWEWSAALRTGASVVPIQSDDLPPECFGDDDDSAAVRADPGDDDPHR